MPDARTLRQAFRNRLLSDAEAMMTRKLGDLRSAIRIVDVHFTLGTLGTALQGGEHVFLRLGLNGPGTILAWSIAATVGLNPAAGSCTVDILNGLSMATLASLCPSNPPRLAAQQELSDQPPSAWSVDLPDPSWVESRVTAVDGVLEQVGVTLRVAVAQAPSTRFVTDSSGAPVVDSGGVPVTWGP